MNILILHNRYKQPGGEDAVYAQDVALLRERGHQVTCYELDNNSSIASHNLIAISAKTIWNQTVYRDLRNVIRTNSIEICHFHNTFPLASPAVYYAAKAENVPALQTLHNYRLLCPGSTLYRDGKVCNDCIGHLVPWSGVQHSCYRNSTLATATTAAMLFTHRLLGTFTGTVDGYIALNDFARQKFIDGGLPANKVVVKTNFITPAPEIGTGGGGYALFAGRLVPEKGLSVLIDAWNRLGAKIPLKICGDGPLAGLVKAAAENNPNIEWTGHVSRERAGELLGEATFLVCPSTWYECMPMSILEAFARGTPVVASNLGALTSIVADGVTGRHFEPGDPASLANSVEWILANPKALSQMRLQARQEFEAHYTADASYQSTLKIYQALLNKAFSANCLAPSSNAMSDLPTPL